VEWLEASPPWRPLQKDTSAIRQTLLGFTDRDTNDRPLLPGLINDTGRNFKIGDVTSDKGYLGADNVP
jgi:hypothetical protein